MKRFSSSCRSTAVYRHWDWLPILHVRILPCRPPKSNSRRHPPRHPWHRAAIVQKSRVASRRRCFRYSCDPFWENRSRSCLCKKAFCVVLMDRLDLSMVALSVCLWVYIIVCGCVCATQSIRNQRSRNQYYSSRVLGGIVCVASSNCEVNQAPIAPLLLKPIEM